MLKLKRAEYSTKKNLANIPVNLNKTGPFYNLPAIQDLLAPRLRLKLIVFALLLTIVVGGSIAFGIHYQGRSRLTSILETKALTISHLIAERLVDEDFFLNGPQLRQQLWEAQVNFSIDYISVTDSWGEILAAVGIMNQTRSSFPEKLLRAGDWISRTEEESLRIDGPIMLPDGTPIGQLHVEFSLDEINQTIHEATRNTLYLTLIFLGIGSAIAFVLALSFSQPIISLVKATKEIGEGRWNSPLPTERSDELGELAKSIQLMAMNWRRNFTQIQALREIELAITSTLELRAILEVLLDKIEFFLPHKPTITVELIDKKIDQLEFLMFRNANEESWIKEFQMRRLLSESYFPITVIESRSYKQILNLQIDPRVRRREFFHTMGLVSYLGIPLWAKNEPVGIINFYYDKPYEYTDEELHFLTALASQGAVAIYNSRLFEATQNQSKELAQLNEQYRAINDALKYDIAIRTEIENQLRSSQQQLRSLAAYVQSVREQERSEIAREIHDELGQVLTAIKMDVAWLTKKLTDQPAFIMDRTKSISDELDHTIDQVRQISTKLRPMVLDHLGLTAAVEWQIGEFETRTGIQCRSLSRLEELDLKPQLATALFRILQETLTNVTRHAQASQVEVTLERTNGQVMLRVKDNGVGVDPGKISDDHSLGLLGMRERASLLGGDVMVGNNPGGGTIITARLPLEI